jgi:metal-dependent hydrolase (beta-lactamase superfamily II)
MTAISNHPSDALSRDIAERDESWAAMLLYVEAKRGQLRGVQENMLYIGPIKKKTAFHALQKSARTDYVIHDIKQLNVDPVQDDTGLSIQYRNGVGIVTPEARGTIDQAIELQLEIRRQGRSR